MLLLYFSQSTSRITGSDGDTFSWLLLCFYSGFWASEVEVVLGVDIWSYLCWVGIVGFGGTFCVLGQCDR